ncbi:hypothetical protein F4604DRAFT_1688183 [Suillus subluteus]|nr:hypothetical protein F4604DRAFT_1688183 [Suillus subluteus]
MSHVTQSHSHSDTDSDFDNKGGDPSHISIPAPSASQGELLGVLKALQVQMQRLQDKNKTLCAKKPKQKWCTDTQHELSIHKDTITIYACKYGMMVEMFPSSNLLNKKLLETPTPFNSPKQYKTVAAQDSTFLHELYQHFPKSLHKIMESSYFSDVVLKSIPDTRANEIKKLCGIAGDIFDLPSKYFTNTNFERATIPKIQQLLGVLSAMNQKYKTFLPVLFLGLKEDGSLKTVFRNWELLAQVLKASLCSVTLLHHRSSGRGGAHTNALKWSIHQITPGVIAWAATTKHIVSIIANINCYVFKAARGPAVDPAKQDHTDAINRALVALDMDSNLNDESDASALISAALLVADPEPSITSVTQSLRTIDARSNPKHLNLILILEIVSVDEGGQKLEGPGRRQQLHKLQFLTQLGLANNF